MTDPEDPDPTSRATTRRRPAASLGSCVAVALVAALGGCERGLCPAAAFEVDILVRLSEEWPAPDDLLITVDCPESLECGFLHGAVTGDAVPHMTISTVLRPADVDVRVLEAASGRELARQVLPVEYVPVGRQNRCGNGRASAEVTVPHDVPQVASPGP